VTVDTVKNAAETPQVAQPYAELGLEDDEYQRIRDILGRRPTSAELAMYSVMWSEHCSYKSSKVTPASSTSAGDMRLLSRSSRTIIPRLWSRIRAPRPASAGSCATF
jgi:phosphoribosylformylglycinamidine (FGAM) synthase-like enzyme